MLLNPQGLSRPVQGLLYLYLVEDVLLNMLSRKTEHTFYSYNKTT
jgi:hypothetical protein